MCTDYCTSIHKLFLYLAFIQEVALAAELHLPYIQVEQHKSSGEKKTI